MRNLIKHLSCLLVLLLAGLALQSCGSDDDNDGSDDTSSLLVGAWESTSYDGNDWDTDRMILNSDGSGLGIEHYASSDSELDPDRYTFSWSYNESTKILAITEDAYYDSVHGTYDDPDTYYYYVSEVNATSATIYEYENGKVDTKYRYIWTRVK